MNRYPKSSRDPSKAIHISQIPATVTEKELHTIFQTVGLIKHLELSQDKEAGKQTLAAICEYNDIESVQEAIDLFNGHPMHGGTILVSTLIDAYLREEQETLVQRQKSSKVGDKSDGSLSSDNQIQEILSSMSEQAQAEVVCEFKSLLTKHPTQARQLLVESPQFSHAILRLMIMYGLINQQDIVRFRQEQQQQKLRKE